MRHRIRFIALSACSFLMTSWGCTQLDQALSPSRATATTCSVKLSYLGSKFITVVHNSTNNNASWQITNTGTTAITLTGQTLSKSGNVTAVHPNVWAPFPYSLLPGHTIDSDLRFDVGAAGSGSVGMTVSSGCGSLVLPAHPVTIT